MEDTFYFGVLASRMHVLRSLAAGSRLAVGNDPVYVKTRCTETIPFPNVTEAWKTRIHDLVEQIDAYRKRQQAQHTGLIFTGIYNVLEKNRKNVGCGELANRAEELHPLAAEADKSKPAWPKTQAQQVQALRGALGRQPEGATAIEMASVFKRLQSKRVDEILETLLAMGHVRQDAAGRYTAQ